MLISVVKTDVDEKGFVGRLMVDGVFQCYLQGELRQGRITVGKRVGEGCLEQSRVAYTALFDKIELALLQGDKVEIEII